mmetsp:Transcript_4719/g.6197  ORF Transcript_4719/g.6197 Transcript_4719/m.6197 type:complete len:82 (+) Transcript_4719:2422-2667(+)
MILKDANFSAQALCAAPNMKLVKPTMLDMLKLTNCKLLVLNRNTQYLQLDLGILQTVLNYYDFNFAGGKVNCGAQPLSKDR